MQQFGGLDRLTEEGIGVTLMLPAGMMASRDIGQDHVATADHAVRNLLAAVLANEPYLITHGNYRTVYQERLAAIEGAFDAMERS